MYLLSFTTGTRTVLGIKIDDSVISLAHTYRFLKKETPPPWLSDMKSLLSKDSSLTFCEKFIHEVTDSLQKEKTENILRQSGCILDVNSLSLAAPIRDPEKIICIGLNYRDHCEEQKRPIPKTPILFSKFAKSIIGPNEDIVKPMSTEKLDFEGELAFIMKKGGKRIPEENAMDHIAGYTIVNDVSARDIQFSDRQWLRGKSFDTFAPMGPFLVTKDEISDPHNLHITVCVNDTIMQDSNTKNMIHRIPRLVSFISQGITLSPGDVIFTGTPAGVGVFRTPPVFLKSGDEISISIEKLGILKNRVIDE
jgi:2-keto-4-pentenoate hydratase/2-oxohepta-3-ene-1,7-dioic acid hydratase in catechol pathway